MLGVAERERPTFEPASPSAEPSSVSSSAGVIAADESLDNVDCRVEVGRGAAGGLAVVLLPREGGARFSVIGGEGEVFGGVLPFAPNRLELGRRPDGGLVAGFGKLRQYKELWTSDSNANAAEDLVPADAPVRIYVDGLVAYETPNAWHFGVARDGSSFFLHEPLGADASRLIVRDLVRGQEEHHYLGPLCLQGGGCRSVYTRAGGEVVLSRVYEDGYGRAVHWFFPADGSGIRRIVAGEGHVYDDSALQDVRGIRLPESGGMWLMSSEEGYFAFRDRAADPQQPAGKPVHKRGWRIVRQEINYDVAGKPVAETAWSRTFVLRGFSGDLTLADNGAWVAFGSRNKRVLDTRTGDVVFEYPAADKQAQLARLTSVLPPGATASDVGSVRGVQFVGNDLVLTRAIRSFPACRFVPAPAQASEAEKMAARQRFLDCQADLRRRGINRSFADIFHMETIDRFAQPNMRIEIDRDMPCGAGNHPLRGLQNHNGRLTFLANRANAP